VVTHPSTSLAIVCLSMGERTGSRAFRHLWSYVEEHTARPSYILYLMEEELSFLEFVLEELYGRSVDQDEQIGA
jgi:hypothetical protein